MIDHGIIGSKSMAPALLSSIWPSMPDKCCVWLYGTGPEPEQEWLHFNPETNRYQLGEVLYQEGVYNHILMSYPVESQFNSMDIDISADCFIEFTHGIDTLTVRAADGKCAYTWAAVLIVDKTRMEISGDINVCTVANTPEAIAKANEANIMFCLIYSLGHGPDFDIQVSEKAMSNKNVVSRVGQLPRIDLNE